MTQLSQPVREGAVRTQQPLSQARHMPAHFYTSPEIYAREKERIFQKEWLCMGRVEELDQPGSYLTFRVAGEPIVICKDGQGELRAFSNVCRHRGTQVAFGESDNGTPFGKGCDKAFSCPYHGWTYDLDGRLLNAPYSAEMEGFDPKDFGLIPLQVDTWAGFLFINFDPAARSLMDVLNEMDFPRTYQPYRYEDFRLASKFSFELDCNWKFVNENLTDIYHIAVLHVNTFGPWQPLDSYEFQPVRGGYHGYFKGKTLAPNGDSLFGTIPWLSGKLAEGGYSSHLRPNIPWFPRHDFLCFMSVWPGESVDKTVGVSYQLFPQQHFEQPDFRDKVRVYDDFLKEFLAEDISMIKSLQQGMDSNYFQPGPMSRFEVAIHSIANYYLERLEAE